MAAWDDFRSWLIHAASPAETLLNMSFR